MDQSSDRKRFWQDLDEEEVAQEDATTVSTDTKKKACQQGLSWWTSMMMGVDYQFKTVKPRDKPSESTSS
eukprot:m.9568 g.9568  ORF g.9568 m.9568 type:complete len:70 (-) comp9449_c0_seq1:96-305(-)